MTGGVDDPAIGVDDPTLTVDGEVWVAVPVFDHPPLTPTPGWTIDILSLDGGTVINAATPFRSARITWALDGTGAAEIDLRASDVADGRWAFGQRRIRLRDKTGTARYQGWLDRLERGSSKLGGGSTKSADWRAASRGLAAILDQRVVHGDFSRVEVVGTTVARDLITHVVTQSYDQTGFTLGSVTGTAPARTRYYCDGDVISDALKELSEASPGGFAWEIDANGAFNAWVGGRGIDRSAAYTIGPQNTLDWSCVGDDSDLVSYATGLGGDVDGPCGPPVVVDFDDTLRTAYGRREAVISEDTASESELEEKTSEEIRARAASRINLRTAWIEGRGPWWVGDVWIGDVVKAQLGAEFGGDLNVRLIAISVSLEPGLHEFIECEWEVA